MAERQLPRAVPDLAHALHDLADHLAYPHTGDLAARVLQQIHEAAPPTELPAVPGRFRLAGRWRRLGAIAAAAILVLILALAISPGARAAITSWLRIGGVVIEVSPHPATPKPTQVGTHLNLGRPISLAAAGHEVGFSIAVPARVGAPDEVYLGGPQGKEVALVYRARRGLPRSGTTGVGLLVTEFRAGLDSTIIKKFAMSGTHVEWTTVHGAPAYWLSGGPHLFGYQNPDGSVTIEEMRLAGNTLLWDRDGITYRLEASIQLGAALRIASSMR